MITEPEVLEAHILVMGDQTSEVSGFGQLLKELGYTRVSVATDPRTVSELLGRHGYDLIVLDLQATATGGPEAIEAIHSRAANGSPVLALVSVPGDRMRALRAGAKDFVSKPFDPVEIKTRIRNLLEVRLLYKKLERVDQDLERRVDERTAELRENEARYRRLTELASDWYWEQDEHGKFTRIYGPVLEMLGIDGGGNTAQAVAGIDAEGWNEAERAALRARIAARRPFIDFVFTRTRADRPQQSFQVSGEPMFDQNARFIGYRGVGIELAAGE